MIGLARRARGGSANGRRGATIIEISVASAIFSIVAYGIVRAASMGVQAEQAVSRSVVDAKELHGALRTIEEELSMSNREAVEHVVDEQGFSTLTFQVPVVTDLGITWGAYDYALGDDDESRNRADWHLCFVPRIVPDTGGERQLVRLVLDDALESQWEEVVVDRIATNGAIGFTAEDTGAVWVLTVRLPADDNGVMQEAVVHVASNN